MSAIRILNGVYRNKPVNNVTFEFQGDRGYPTPASG
jgi:hypothetical protein